MCRVICRFERKHTRNNLAGGLYKESAVMTWRKVRHECHGYGPLRGIHVSSSGWSVYCLSGRNPLRVYLTVKHFDFNVNATDVGKIVGTRQLVLLLESRFGCYLGWGDHLRIFHLFRLFFSFSSMRDRMRMAVFLQFYFLLTGKKEQVFAGLELNLFFLC